MPHSVSHIYAHLVFATKNRQPLLEEQFRVNVEKYLSKVFQNAEQVLIAQYAMPDHYHGLFRVNVRKPIAGFIRILKSAATFHINEQFLPGNFSWQNGYGIFSHTAGI